MFVEFQLNSQNEVNASDPEQPTARGCSGGPNDPEANMPEEGSEMETEAAEVAAETVGALPSDGCLVIGNNGNKYFTRNLTNFVEQETLINNEVVTSEYFPCCREVKDASIAWNVLGAFRNEIFLYCLHLMVISLGVIKESMVVNGGEKTDGARLVYTCVETTTTVVLIFMRTMNAWLAYSSSRQDMDRIGFFHGSDGGGDGGSGGGIEAALSVRRFFRLYLVAAGVLLLLCTTTFIACLSVDQLEWTVLSNIVCIVTVNLLSSLYAVRVSRTMDWVRCDAHRVAVLEAVTLVRICSTGGCHSSSDGAPSSSPGDPDNDDAPVPLPPPPPPQPNRLLERFAEAVECSLFFQRPPYICVAGFSRQSQQTPDICSNV